MPSRRPLAATLGALALFVALLAGGRPGLAWTAFVVALAIFSLASPLSLNGKIAIGALFGIALGLLPDSGIAEVRIFGRVFIGLLKMLIVPMILFSIAYGVAEMGGARNLGRVGARTVALYLATMAAAVAVGLLAVNIVDPGTGGSLRETAFFTEAAGSSVRPDADLALSRFLLDTVFLILANPFESVTEGRILPIVFFAILFGLALVRIGPVGRPVVDVLRAGHAAVMEIIHLFLQLAPVGIFALIAHLVATVGFRVLVENLLGFSLVVIGATLFHGAVTLPLFARALAGVGPLELFRGLREALLVAFSTSSSVATLPVTHRCVEENFGVPKHVSSFVLPLGATVNMDGTALYEAIAALFVANVYGLELSIGSQLVVFAVAMLTAVGAPGIPSAGMVTMVVVLEAVGLPVEAIGILLTVDRLLDTFRTAVNVEGDAVVSLCVARAEDASLEAAA